MFFFKIAAGGKELAFHLQSHLQKRQVHWPQGWGWGRQEPSRAKVQWQGEEGREGKSQEPLGSLGPLSIIIRTLGFFQAGWEANEQRELVVIQFQWPLGKFSLAALLSWMGREARMGEETPSQVARAMVQWSRDCFQTRVRQMVSLHLDS